VKLLAFERGIPVSERAGDVVDSGAELGVVVAFGRLVRPEVLERLPMVNAHFSLLPRWRGAAPVERAILAGDATTGVCLMALEEGLDTGPVYACATVTIGEDETAGELRSRLASVACDLLVERLAGGVAGLGEAVAQQGEPTYAAKLTPAELAIGWERPTLECHRLVRVGRAWTTFRGRRLLVWRARPAVPAPVNAGVGDAGPGAVAVPPGTLRDGLVATGDGFLELLEVQGEGRAVQPYAAWALGARPLPGERLGEPAGGGPTGGRPLAP
jgi:methionyl-tRNA formyltransferase